MKKNTSPDNNHYFLSLEWNSTESKNNSLIRAIKDGIQTGRLKGFLPSSRTLAQLLLVHRNTVTKALEELVWEGWLESYPKKGYFINESMIQQTEQQAQKNYKLPYKLPEPQLVLPPTTASPNDDKNLLLLARKMNDKKIKIYAEDDVYHYLAQIYKWTIPDNKLHFVRNLFDTNYIIARMLLEESDTIIVSKDDKELLRNHLPNLDITLVNLPMGNNAIDLIKLQQIFESNREVKCIYLHHSLGNPLLGTPQHAVSLMELCYRYGVIIWENITLPTIPHRQITLKKYDYKHYVISCLHHESNNDHSVSYLVLHQNLEKHLLAYKQNLQVSIPPILLQYHLHHTLLSTKNRGK